MTRRLARVLGLTMALGGAGTLAAVTPPGPPECGTATSTFTFVIPTAIPTGPAVASADLTVAGAHGSALGRRCVDEPDAHVRGRPRHHDHLAGRNDRDTDDRQWRRQRQRFQRHGVGRRRESGGRRAVHHQQRFGIRSRLCEPDNGNPSRPRGRSVGVPRGKSERDMDHRDLGRPCGRRRVPRLLVSDDHDPGLRASARPRPVPTRASRRSRFRRARPSSPRRST